MVSHRNWTGYLGNHLKHCNVVMNTVKLTKRDLDVKILTQLNFLETFLSEHLHPKEEAKYVPPFRAFGETSVKIVIKVMF